MTEDKEFNLIEMTKEEYKKNINEAYVQGFESCVLTLQETLKELKSKI